MGFNPLNPPCLAGQNAITLKMVADRKGTPLESGTPQGEAMEGRDAAAGTV